MLWAGGPILGYSWLQGVAIQFPKTAQRTIPDTVRFYEWRGGFSHGQKDEGNGWLRCSGLRVTMLPLSSVWYVFIRWEGGETGWTVAIKDSLFLWAKFCSRIKVSTAWSRGRMEPWFDCSFSTVSCEHCMVISRWRVFNVHKIMKINIITMAELEIRIFVH